MGILADAMAATRYRATWARTPWPDWTGQPVVVVGSGPSATDCDLEAIRGRAKVITVNGSFRLAPWADFHHANDTEWWSAHRGALGECRGQRVAGDVEAAALPGMQIRPLRRESNCGPDVLREMFGRTGALGMLIEANYGDPRLTGCHFIIRPGTVGDFVNHSGPQAVNLALSLGARRIVLAGFDMHLGRGTHWHGDHPFGLQNPRPETIDIPRALLDLAAPSAAAAGAEIVNACPGSALRAFPKMEWSRAVDWLLP